MQNTSPVPFSLPQISSQQLEKLHHGWIYGLLALGIGAIFGGLVGWGISPVFLVGGGIALAGGLYLLNRLELGLYILAFITYTRLSDILVQYHSAPSIAKPVLGGLLALVILRWIIFKVEPKGWMKVTSLGFTYMLLVLAGVLYAREPERTWLAFDDLIKDIALAILVVSLLQHRYQLRPLIWSLLAAGGFMATITSYQFLTNQFNSVFWGFGQAAVMNIVGSTEGQRISGPIGDPNFYAQILVVLAPLALDRLWNERPLILRGLAAYILLVLFSSILFTFSRGAFIVLAAALVLLLIYRRPRPVELLVYGLLVILSIPFIPSNYIERVATIADLSGGSNAIRSEVSFRGRASELLAAWQMFSDHPIIGVAAHNYPAYYQDYSQVIGFDPRSEARQAHNLFLEVAAETGVVGLTIFFLILFFCYRSLWKAWRGFKQLDDQETVKMVVSITIAFSAYLLTSFFIHAAYPRYFWLLVGLTLALPQLVEISKPEVGKVKHGNR